MKKLLFVTFITLLAVYSYGQQQLKNTTLDSLRMLKGDALENKIQSLKNGSEDDISQLASYYMSIEKPIDELRELVLKRFPKGNYAFSLASQQFYKISDAIAQETELTKLQSEFSGQDFSTLFFQLSQNFITSKNGPKAAQYFAQIKGTYKVQALLSLPSQIMNFDMETAENLIVSQQKEDNTQDEKSILLLLHSDLMSKKGNHIKAYEIYNQFYEKIPQKNAAQDAKYYSLLSKVDPSEKALEGLKNAIISGVNEPQYRTELKELYAKLNPEKNPEEYLATLDKNIKDQVNTDVKSKLKKIKAQQFTVTDAEGKKVSLEDFKGKTLVIDFWATWCGPCKASLPTMQKIVNNYKNDPNVKFLFIHTWEISKAPLEDAKKYLADNNLELPLYMDTKNPSTKSNEAVVAFGTKSIPAKYVIDKNGFIRFESLGFNKNEENAINELSAMIELSKSVVD